MTLANTAALWYATGMTTAPAEPWTILRLLNWTKEYFVKGEVGDPRLSAEILLAHVLGCKRIELYTRFDYQPATAQLDAYRELVSRARQHEPIAYLAGRREFYSLEFRVTKDVLIPRPETELLVAHAVEHLKALGRPGQMWDACTGSGCVAVAAASCVADLTVLATDISEPAVKVAAQNAALNKVDGRVRCRTADLLTLPEDCGDLKDFDVITANPPYIVAGQPIGESVKHEPALALYAGKEGFELISPIVAAAPKFLRPGGLLAMEFGMDQADGIRDLMLATGEFNEPKILLDHQGIERAAVVLRK